jgi:F-type H+-transporting ATPase subunit b
MAMQHSEDPVAGAAPAAPGHEAPAGREGAAAAEGHGSGGMPQFDFTLWPGQIAWFLIVFFGLLIFIRLFAAPKIGGAIAEREDRIAEDIAQARNLKAEADAQAQVAAEDRARARAEAQRLAQDARNKARAQAAERLAAEEARLAATTGKAEASIAEARDRAMANVGEIASQTAQAIVERLTGRAASADEVAAAQAARG